MRMNKLLLLILLIFSSIKAFAQQYILDQIYDEQRDMGETPFSNLIILVIVIGILYIGHKIFHKEETNDNDFNPNDVLYEDSKCYHSTSYKQINKTISPIIVPSNTTDKENATIVEITIVADILYADFIVDWFDNPKWPDHFIDDFEYSFRRWLKKDWIKIYADGKDITDQIGDIYIDTKGNAKNFYFPQLDDKNKEFRFRGIEYNDSYESRTTYHYKLRIDEESFDPSKFRFIAVELANRENKSLSTKAILPNLVVYNQRKHKLEESQLTPIYIHVVGTKRHFAFNDDIKKKHELFYSICDVLHNNESIYNKIGKSLFTLAKGEYTDESDWTGSDIDDTIDDNDDEIEKIYCPCYADLIQDEYWKILINGKFDPKLLNLIKHKVTNDTEDPFVYSSRMVKYNHYICYIDQLDWIEYHKLVESEIK